MSFIVSNLTPISSLCVSESLEISPLIWILIYRLDLERQNLIYLVLSFKLFREFFFLPSSIPAFLFLSVFSSYFPSCFLSLLSPSSFLFFFPPPSNDIFILDFFKKKFNKTLISFLSVLFSQKTTILFHCFYYVHVFILFIQIQTECFTIH